MTWPTRRTVLAAMLTSHWLPARAAEAAPAEVLRALPGARLQGQATARFFGLHVYDILLWAAQAGLKERWPESPLALEIVYARDLVGRRIAERSIEEMQRQPGFQAAREADWLAQMTRLFPDVKSGDRLTGLQRPGQGARFYFNGSERGEIADPAFARLFFGIWLSPQTSEPDMRAHLLGGPG